MITAESTPQFVDAVPYWRRITGDGKQHVNTAAPLFFQLAHGDCWNSRSSVSCVLRYSMPAIKQCLSHFSTHSLNPSWPDDRARMHAHHNLYHAVRKLHGQPLMSHVRKSETPNPTSPAIKLARPNNVTSQKGCMTWGSLMQVWLRVRNGVASQETRLTLCDLQSTH